MDRHSTIRVFGSRVLATAASQGRPLRALAVVFGLALVLAAGLGAARTRSVVPSRVQVVAKEFYFTLSRRSVTAGPAIVELVNFGQDAHDLRLERIGSKRVYGTPIIQPGDHYDLNVKLLPGTYELWCSIANHRALGMQAKIVVRSAP